MNNYILRILLAGLLLICTASQISAEKIEYIRDDNFIGMDAGSGLMLFMNTENKTAYLKNVSNGDIVSLSNLDFWPVYEYAFNDDGSKIFVHAGGNSAVSPKIIMQYDCKSGQPDWSYPINGDFVSNMSYSDGLLAVSLHNAGAVIVLDLLNMQAGGQKIYGSQCYKVLASEDGFFTYGCESYKEKEYSVKFLDKRLQTVGTVDAGSDGYGFIRNKKGNIVRLSGNFYIVPDYKITVYDREFNELNSIVLDGYPQTAVFSDDGETIIAACGGEGDISIYAYSLDGEVLSSRKVETDGEWVNVQRLFSTSGSLYVQMGKSER